MKVISDFSKFDIIEAPYGIPLFQKEVGMA